MQNINIPHFITQIYDPLNNFSSNALQILFSLEDVFKNFFQTFWVRLPEWTFIFVATIIASYVAIKIDRRFADRRITNKVLWKEIGKVSLKTTGIVFGVGLLGFIAFLAIIEAIRWSSKYSALGTLVLVLLVILYFRSKKKKKNRELTSRFQTSKGKEGINLPNGNF